MKHRFGEKIWGGERSEKKELVTCLLAEAKRGRK
jgi:hypothetical protein